MDGPVDASVEQNPTGKDWKFHSGWRIFTCKQMLVVRQFLLLIKVA